MKKKFSLFIFILFFLSRPTLADPSSQLASQLPNQFEDQKLNLQATIRYALQSSPTLKAARNSVLIAELSHRDATSKLLPSIDLQSTQGLQNYFAVNTQSAIFAGNPSAPWISNLNLGITETLYDNGTTWTQISITRFNQEMSETHYQKIRDSLILDVAAEFLHFSLSFQLLEVRQQQESMLKKQFSTLSYQYHQGLKTRVDYLRLKTQVQRAEIQRISAEKDIKVSTTLLYKLIGVSVNSPDSPEFLPIVVKTEEPLEKLLPTEKPLLSRFYDSKIYELQNQLNEKNIYLSQRAYWPQVSIAGGISLVNTNYLSSNSSFWDGNILSWNALLLIQYNILDWGVRKRAIQTSELNADIQLNNLSNTLMGTQAAINALMLDLEQMRKTLAMSRELLSIEEQSFSTLEAQYRNAKLSFLDLMTGFNNLLDARLQYYTSYFDAQGMRLKYDYYKGILYDSISRF